MLSFGAESFVFQFAIQIYKHIQNQIMLVILYGCETWSLTLREERRLRVFDKRVLSRKYGPKRNEGTRKWEKIYNENLNDLFLSPNIIRVISSRRMRWTEHVACVGSRGVYMVVVGRPERKRSLGRPRRNWEDNI